MAVFMEASMQLIQTCLFLVLFCAVELTRAVLWAARTVDEPDRDGPLLRALFGLVIHIFSVVPRPVWTLVAYVGWLAWIPVRVILWASGIGRERLKRSPRAVTHWYARRRNQRTRLLRKRKEQDDE